MKMYKETINLKSYENKTSYIDVTQQVRDVIVNSKVTEGIVAVISPHTTCSIFFEEFSHDINENNDEFLQEDLNNVLGKMIPDHDSASTYRYPGPEHYSEVEKWPNVDEYLPGGDKKALWNGDAHLKSTIIGSSEVFEVSNSNIGIGKTGYIYFVDFDTTRSRKRKCKVIVMGE